MIEEVTKIKETLMKETNIDIDDVDIITKIAIKEVKELSGIETHLYAEPLIQKLTENERYLFLKSLFLVAASDYEVSNVESEEIRIISKSLNLEQKHFISARASVKEKLGAMKGI